LPGLTEQSIRFRRTMEPTGWRRSANPCSTRLLSAARSRGCKA